MEKYVGSLPKGKKALKWVDDGVRIPRGVIEDVFSVDMQTPMSSVFQNYTAYLPYTAERKAALDAIAYILDIRYTNSLREDEGGTYGASANAMFTRRPEELVKIQVGFDCRPSLCDKLRELAIQGIQDLADNGPTDEEVTSAVLNLKKNLPERRQNNSYWQGAIESYLRYGRDIDVDDRGGHAAGECRRGGITDSFASLGMTTSVIPRRPKADEGISNKKTPGQMVGSFDFQCVQGLLTGSDRLGRADAGAGAAVDADVSVDAVDIAFVDGAGRAFALAGSACCSFSFGCANLSNYNLFFKQSPCNFVT